MLFSIALQAPVKGGPGYDSLSGYESYAGYESCDVEEEEGEREGEGGEERLKADREGKRLCDVMNDFRAYTNRLE